MAVLLGRHVVAGYLVQFRVTNVLANKQIAGAGLDVFIADNVFSGIEDSRLLV